MLNASKIVIIFGAAGQVGKELVEIFDNENYKVVKVTRNECNLTSSEQIKQVFANVFEQYTKTAVGAVINAAAYTAVDKAEDERELAQAVNTKAVKVMAELCKSYDVHFIHISTDYVFDGNKSVLYSEDDIQNPQGVYGRTKFQGEQAIQNTWHKHIILRVSWVFGQYGNNFVKTIAKHAKDKQELAVVADQYGAPTPARAIASAILSIISKIRDDSDNDLYGVYHFSGYPLTTWQQLAQYVINNTDGAITKSLKPLQTHECSVKAIRPKNSGLNCNKILKNFGVEQPLWLNYISETINYIEEEYV